jgi:hypothetical protein
MRRLDERLVDRLDIDCHTGFRTLLQALNDEHGITPIILDHSNSAKILKKAGIKSVASYHTAYFVQGGDSTSGKADLRLQAPAIRSVEGSW